MRLICIRMGWKCAAFLFGSFNHQHPYDYTRFRPHSQKMTVAARIIAEVNMNAQRL